MADGEQLLLRRVEDLTDAFRQGAESGLGIEAALTLVNDATADANRTIRRPGVGQGGVALVDLRLRPVFTRAAGDITANVRRIESIVGRIREADEVFALAREHSLEAHPYLVELREILMRIAAKAPANGASTAATAIRAEGLAEVLPLSRDSLQQMAGGLRRFTVACERLAEIRLD